MRKKINSRENRGGGVGEVMEPCSAQYQRASVTLLVYLLVSTLKLVKAWVSKVVSAMAHNSIHYCARRFYHVTHAHS